MKLTKKLKRQIDAYFKSISEEEFLEITQKYGMIRPVPTSLDEIDGLDPRIVGAIEYLKESEKDTQPIIDLITLYEIRKDSIEIYGPMTSNKYPQWEIRRDPASGSLQVMRISYPERNKYNTLLRFITDTQAKEFVIDQEKLLKQIII